MGKLIQSQRMRMSLAAVGGGLTVVLIGAGALALASSASAGSASPSPSKSGSTATPWPSKSGSTATPKPGQQGHGSSTQGPGRPGFGRGFGGGLGAGLGGVLHGTGVVKKADGSFQTIAVQRGTVTAVSATSISVKSLDGYVATYVVNSTTKINGKNGKITDIKTGDQVGVEATVSGGTSTAVRIIDLTTAMKNFDHKMRQWFGGQGPNGKPSTSPSPATSGTA
jgi:hypothetical protein